MKEKAVASHIRLAAAQDDIYLWRNNRGAFLDERGILVRYGLANESKQMDDHIKSSDFIGMTPVVITPDMVGQVVAIFTAIETKPTDWIFSASDKRSCAQLNFIDIVNRAGGRAGFARTVQEYKAIVKK